MAICNLSQETFDHLMEILDENDISILSPIQLARLSGISNQRIYEWLKQGEKDRYEGVDSLYAQFSGRKEFITGKIVQNIISEVKAKNTFKANTWLLTNFLSKEFGNDSAALEEMKEIYRAMKDIVSKGA